MNYLIINIILLAVLVVLLVSFLKNTTLRWFFSILFSSYIALQISSLYITSSFIGYKFYIHFNLRDLKSMMALFYKQLFIIIPLLIIVSIIVFKSRIKTHKLKKYLRCILIVICLLFMSFKNGIVSTTIDFVSIIKTKNISLDQSLLNLGIKEYTFPDKVKAKKGKNIIVISLESFESGFLSDELAHLTPNLRRLKNNWNYFEMKETPGSSWTSGSLYTSLTGFPAFFNQHGNSIFQNSFKSNITSIGTVLKRANYNTKFLIGDAQFAGTNDMLKTFDIENIIDKTKLSHKYKITESNSLHDKDLFLEAKKQLLNSKKLDKPFSLFISTLSTHFPNGIYDDRMEEHITKKRTNFNFMVASVDYMLGDFIQFLKDEKMLENTIIYIYPDHLKMGSDAIFKNTGKRGLYLLTNASKNDLSYKTSDTIYQIDIPKIILDGAKVEHNAKFLIEFIDNSDKIKFIKNNISSITSLNTLGLKKIKKLSLYPKIKDKYKEIRDKTKNLEIYLKDNKRFIAHAGGMIDNKTYTNALEALDVNYKKGFRLFELDIIKTTDGKYVAAHDWKHWAKNTNYKEKTPVTESVFLNQKILNKYTPLNLQAINDWFKKHKDAYLVTDKINEPKQFSDLFIDKNRLIMELFSEEALKEALNINIYSAMPNQSVIEKLGKNNVAILTHLGIKHIAVSRKYIKENFEFLKAIKKNGIKTYVYHINFNESKDEKYVVKNEMDYIYGLYADKWNFNLTVDELLND